MKFMNLCAAAMLAVLAACGGGGGDSPSGVTPPVTPPVVTPPVVTPPVTSVTCPDGSSAPTGAQCAAVTASSSIAADAVVDPSVVNAGLLIQFSGVVKPEGAVYNFTQAGAPMSGALTANAASTALTFTPSIRVGFGQATVFVMDINDALGRPLHVEVKFTTKAMVCTSNAKWSNPATFAADLGNCLAPVGVQALYDSTNTVQDNSCSFTPGQAVTAECAKYSYNGTLVLNDTSIIVENHPVMWVGYNAGSPGNLKGTIALVDRTTMKVVGVAPLTGQIIWTTGNPTGEAASFQLVVSGTARTSTFQVRWDGAAITTTCAANCS